jgi:hypothetical protein
VIVSALIDGKVSWTLNEKIQSMQHENIYCNIC